MRLIERQVSISSKLDSFDSIQSNVALSLAEDEIPARFAVTKSDGDAYECEIGVIEGRHPHRVSPLFEFRRREYESQESFNVAFIVPTGIGAEIGGHSGDATPAAILFSHIADTLLTHPNVVNASDINELPSNGLYVEGSVLTRLIMGTVGLRPSRSNRVLVALDASYNERYAQYTVNAVNAARATYGLNCAGIVSVEPPIKVVGGYSDTGRASGYVEGIGGLVEILKRDRDEYDAVALASVVEVPPHYHYDYFTSGGEMINPWGGVEAMLTHAVSAILNIPTAHAPMMESDEIAAVDPGIVDSRMAAEIISITFIQSVLKGLHRAPSIVTDASRFYRPDVIAAEDISCIVIPDGCIGLPTLAALKQDIPVIAVRENRSLMQNDLERLPWNSRRFYMAENYWEAAGIAASLKAGLDPRSVRRPLNTLRPH